MANTPVIMVDDTSIDKYRVAATYFIPTEVDTGTTPPVKLKLLTTKPTDYDGADVPSYIQIPTEKDSGYKPELEKFEAVDCENVTRVKRSSQKGGEYKSMFLQRDVATKLLCEIWEGYFGVLLVKAHRFRQRKKQEYQAYYGQIQRSDAEQKDDTGETEFIFAVTKAPYDIDIVAAGDLTPPVLDPVVDITIKAGKFRALKEITYT